ncbi:MAG: NUDIX hydrolase [Candidatus Liptonbacteria bacterium]|nr:NUDIX hydrolase [Candidatus Liptonbacteria bacterium]
MKKGLIIHTVIYNDNGKVLIIKRSKKNEVLPEYWDIPGGTLEDGEDPATGAIREVKEETNLKIHNPSFYFEKSNIDKNKNRQFVTLVFFAKYLGDEIALNPDEHDEYKWIDISEVGNYKTVDYLVSCLNDLESKGIMHTLHKS